MSVACILNIAYFNSLTFSIEGKYISLSFNFYTYTYFNNNKKLNKQKYVCAELLYENLIPAFEIRNKHEKNLMQILIFIYIPISAKKGKQKYNDAKNYENLIPAFYIRNKLEKHLMQILIGIYIPISETKEKSKQKIELCKKFTRI